MAATIVLCPECQAKLKVSGAVSPGKKIRCPKCQAPFAVPAEDEVPPLEESVTARPVKAPARKAPPPDVDDEEDEVLPPRKAAKRRPVEDEEDDEPRPARRPVRHREEEDEDEEGRPARRAIRGRDMDDDNADEDRPRRRKPIKRKKAKGNAALLWSLIGGGALVIAGGTVALILWLNKGDDKSSEGIRQPGGNRFAGGGPDPRLAAWNPDPAAVQQLGPERTYKGYRFRPPKGFNELKVGGDQQMGFTGPPHADGVSPTFVVGVLNVPPGAINKPVDQFFKDALVGYENQIRRVIPDVSHGEIERGLINGLSFQRTQINGTISIGKVKVKGYFCIHITQNNAVLLAWLDGEKDYATSGKILEAAALSLTKG